MLLFIQVCKWLLASHPGGSSRFMLRKPELSTGPTGHSDPYKGFNRISVRRYFPRLDYQPLFMLTPKVTALSPLHVNKMRRHEKRCISFSGSVWPPKGYPFHWFSSILCEQFHFFFLHACFYCFSWFETSHGYTCFICKYISVPIKLSFKQPRC